MTQGHEPPIRECVPAAVPGSSRTAATGAASAGARAGDPLWDVATIDFRPAGLVPDAFHDGYGAPPPEPQASVYDLLMAAWRTRAELEGGGPGWRWPPQSARLAYLRDLPSRLARLAAALGIAG